MAKRSRKRSQGSEGEMKRIKGAESERRAHVNLRHVSKVSRASGVNQSLQSIWLMAGRVTFVPLFRINVMIRGPMRYISASPLARGSLHG
jgi:hypothetical protein